MSDQNEVVELDDVLNEYVSSTENPSHANLMEWIQRYPQFENELTEFTVNWSVMKTLPPIGEISKNLEDRLINKGMSVVQNLLYQKRQERIKQNENKREFKGITQERKNKEMSLQYLAEHSRLSIALLAKLERRHFIPSTIPYAAPVNIGRTLYIPPQLILEQFQGPPWVDAGANRFSSDKPKLASQTNFFDEVRNDRTIKEEDREYWLAMEIDQNKD